MAVRLYLRNTDTHTGFAATELSSVMAPTGGTGNPVNLRRDLSTTKGTTQTSNNAASVSSTANHVIYFGKWISEPLAVTSITAQTWTFASGCAQANNAANSFTAVSIYVMTSGGAVRGFVYDAATPLGSEWGTTEDGRLTTVSGALVSSVVSTDRLVVEWWRVNTPNPSMAGPYAQTIYWDGTTDPQEFVASGNHATYLETPQDGLFGSGATISADTVPAVAAIPAVTVAADWLISASVVSAVAAIPAVTTIAYIAPATVAAVAAVPAPAIALGVALTPATVTATAAIGAPSVGAAATVTPGTVVATGAIGAPAVQAGAGAAPTAVAAAGAIPAVTAGLVETLQPGPVAALTRIPGPGITSGGGSGAVAPVGSVTDFWKYESSVTGGQGVTPWPAVSRTSPAITLQVGDLLWAVVSWNVTEAATMASPAGWTVVTGWPRTQGPVGQVLLYRVVTDVAAITDPGNDSQYVWTPSAAARGNAAIRVFRGADTGTPLDVTPVATQALSGTGGSANTITEVTTATDGAYVVNGISIEASAAGTTLTHNTGTKIWDLVGRRQAYAEEGAQASAGASGSVTWAISAATLNYIGYQAALRPGTATAVQAAFANPEPVRALATIPAPAVGVPANAPATVPAVAAIPAPAITGVPGTITHLWAGGSTTGGFVVAAKLAATSSARLKVSTSADLLTDPVFSAPVTPDAQGYARLAATGLSAGTAYYYRIESNGVLITGTTGQCRTAPSGQASFSFVFGSCSLQDTAPGSFTRAKARNPDLCLIHGDFGYIDIASNDPAGIRSSREALIALSTVQAMLRDVPTFYTWSDHDFGVNNADATSASKPAAQAVYRQQVPHPALEVSDGIYHSFTWGRVRFVVTDNRSFKSANDAADNSSKTVLGTTQKTWFKDLITSCTEPLIFWVNEQPWIGPASTPDDEWYAYDTERQELAAHFAASGKQVVILAGDMHAVAADNGTGSPGGVPVMHAAPWRNTFSNKGGPYTSGPYPTSGASEIEQYGHVVVTDTGVAISAAFTGYDSADTARATLTVTKAVQAPATVAALAAIPAPSVTTGADTEAPSVPTGLQTTAVGSVTADLAWTASTDNVGVTQYEIKVIGPRT